MSGSWIWLGIFIIGIDRPWKVMHMTEARQLSSSPLIALGVFGKELSTCGRDKVILCTVGSAATLRTGPGR